MSLPVLICLLLVALTRMSGAEPVLIPTGPTDVDVPCRAVFLGLTQSTYREALSELEQSGLMHSLTPERPRDDGAWFVLASIDDILRDMSATNHAALHLDGMLPRVEAGTNTWLEFQSTDSVRSRFKLGNTYGVEELDYGIFLRVDTDAMTNGVVPLRINLRAAVPSLAADGRFHLREASRPLSVSCPPNATVILSGLHQLVGAMEGQGVKSLAGVEIARWLLANDEAPPDGRRIMILVSPQRQ